MNRSVAYGAMVLAACLWGTSYTVVKIGLSVLDPPLPPLVFLSLRFVFALILVSPLIFFPKFRNDTRTLVTNKLIILLGVVNGLSYSLQFIGQVNTPAAIATLLINTYLLSTPILSAITLKTKIPKILLISAGLGLLGVMITSWDVFLTQIPTEAEIQFLGATLIVLFSGLAWGGYGVVSSLLHEKAEEVGMTEVNNDLAVFFSSNFYSVLVIVVLLFFSGQQVDLLTLTIEPWFVILYLAIFATITPFILYIYASKTMKPTEMNVITLLNIIVGLILANIVLSEQMSILGIGGSVIIILSIYLASTANKKYKTE